MLKRFVVFVGLLCAVMCGAAQSVQNDSSGEPDVLIHAVSDLGHQFSFYADGRFHKQYLPGQPRATCWGALYRYDFSNVNMLLLLGCESRLCYTSKDIETIRQFLKDGGVVVLFAQSGDNPMNQLATELGCTFKGPARKAYRSVAGLITGPIEGSAHWMEFRSPQGWIPLIEDVDSRPVLAMKRIGQGTLLVAARGLAGSHPSAKDNINAKWWISLLEKIAQSKKVDANKPFRSLGLEKLEHVDDFGSIKVRYSDYLQPYARAMGEIYQRIRPVMRQRLGVPLSDGMASEIGLLATGGGGFSSGRMLGLAVFWGNFPEREDSMIEFISHETTHSWVLPYAEIWNEPIATYVGDLVMMDMGHEAEALRRINAYIERAKRIDPTMKCYDIDGNSLVKEALTGNQKNDMHWGKTFWIFEELRKENPDFLADYFIAKRKLVPAGTIKKYDANATVSVVSAAMGRDMFGWFREHGFDVNKAKSEIAVD